MAAKVSPLDVRGKGMVGSAARKQALGVGKAFAPAPIPFAAIPEAANAPCATVKDWPWYFPKLTRC
jgi:hypothetical protein